MTDQPKIARCSIYKAVEAVFMDGVRKATVFQHPQLTVVATIRHKPHTYMASKRRVEIHLTIGQPNSKNRKFVKDCLKAGEPFPVRKVQLVWWPKK